MSRLLRSQAPFLRVLSTRSVNTALRTPLTWNQSEISLLRTHMRQSVAGFHHGQIMQFKPTTSPKADADGESASVSSEAPPTKFVELETRQLVHPNVVDTITQRMKLETMTDVQSRTIYEALSGVDVIAKAKTGTGKTLAFLLPIVQNIIKADPLLAFRDRRSRASPDDIRAIIISPTRELAEQIAVEARRLTCQTNIVVQTAVGGTQKRRGLMEMERSGCHLLVATPGRLNDILSDPFSNISAPGLTTLVFDEADRLMEQGFQLEIAEIMKSLPDPRQTPRQTLMFSATMPREVLSLARSTIRPDHRFVSCVNENELPTHERVPQKIVQVNGIENFMPSLYELCQRELQTNKGTDVAPFKAIVFLNSTANVTLTYELFENLRDPVIGRPLYGVKFHEIHSKLTQGQRTAAATQFRRDKSAILFSSDVTARGMDFPGVTHVIQVGVPRQKEDYIHRLGRTGRAGKEGSGWLLISSLETRHARSMLRDLPLERDDSLVTAQIDMTQEAQIPEEAANILDTVALAYKKIARGVKGKAFTSEKGVLQWNTNIREVERALKNWVTFGMGISRGDLSPNELSREQDLDDGFATPHPSYSGRTTPQDSLVSKRIDRGSLFRTAASERKPFGQYDRGQSDRGQFGRGQPGREQSGRGQSGRGQFGRGQFGREQFGRGRTSNRYGTRDELLRW